MCSSDLVPHDHHHRRASKQLARILLCGVPRWATSAAAAVAAAATKACAKPLKVSERHCAAHDLEVWTRLLLLGYPREHLPRPGRRFRSGEDTADA